jgi:hypothetical protein
MDIALSFSLRRPQTEDGRVLFIVHDRLNASGLVARIIAASRDVSAKFAWRVPSNLAKGYGE